MATVRYFWHSLIHRGKTFMCLQYSRPLIYRLFPNVKKASFTTSMPIFVDAPYWPPYSTDKFISCVLPGSSQWFFHFGEEIVIAWTQEKTMTLVGTKFQQSRCCHGAVAPLAMRDSGTSTIFTRYESMWLRFPCQSERTTARDPVNHKKWTSPCYRAFNAEDQQRWTTLSKHWAKVKNKGEGRLY